MLYGTIAKSYTNNLTHLSSAFLAFVYFIFFFSFFNSSSSILFSHSEKKNMFRQSVSIDLVEPMVCLRGQPNDKQTVNIIRGAVRLQLSHAAIVHSIAVQFTGTSKTLWPEGKNNKKS